LDLDTRKRQGHAKESYGHAEEIPQGKKIKTQGVKTLKIQKRLLGS